MKKFLIYAPSYDPNSGGCIVLHKLCDCLNRLGYEAFIYPMIPSFELNAGSAHTVKTMLAKIVNAVSGAKSFKVNPEFITPILQPRFEDFAADDTVVVYPEVTFGNPLKAKNVVRWILYTPGETVPAVYYGFDELHFLFHESFGKYKFPRCHTSNKIIRINYWPVGIYMNGNECRDRKGVAYSVRKSSRAPDSDLVASGVCIDGKSHQEVATIFQRVKTFVSYDLYSGYSTLASLAGCDSVVMPLEHKLSCEVYPDMSKLDGIAYGFDDVDRANITRAKLIWKIRRVEEDALDITKIFVSEINSYFSV